jgi:tetratricopeptide (TPR) repeat protein
VTEVGGAGGVPDTVTLEAWADAHRWSAIREVLATRSDAELRDDPRAALLLAEALLHLGEPRRARRLARAAAAALRAARDPRNLLRALNVWGAASFELGDLGGAEARFDEMWELALETGHEEMRARAANNLGALASLRGDHERALSLYRVALPAYQRLGWVRGLAQTEHNLAILHRDRGDWAESDRWYRRAWERARRIPDPRLAAMAAVGRAELACLRGDPDAAAAAARRALEDLVEYGDALGQADALRVLGMASRAWRDWEEAARRFDAALEIARANGNPLLEAELWRERGLLERERGRARAGRRALERALGLFERLGARAEARKTRALLGRRRRGRGTGRRRGRR